MLLPRTTAIVDLIQLESSPSTNDEVRTRSAGAAEFLTVITTEQTAGRGRLGRQWSTPKGQGLAASVLVRPRLPDGSPLDQRRWGWLPLIAGAAMTSSVAALTDADVGLKWPNDVLVRGKKVCGILTEVMASESAIVIGAGLNLTIARENLPTPTSTSLTLEGVTLAGDELVDAALNGWLEAFIEPYSAFLASGGDADASGIRSLVVRCCTSIGRRVDVQLPSGLGYTGAAVDIDSDGRLMVKRDADGVIVTVAAGDVTHLRYE